MDESDPSVFGNLPRSRPGTRSEKRAREERREAAAERPRPTPPRKRARRAAPDAADAARVSEPRVSEPAAGGGPQDAVAGAVKLAGQVASAGVQVGTGVAREVLRRLPGPW
jgi:hypothetical protein